jgi:trehalose 6-phosphate phosphatase
MAFLYLPEYLCKEIASRMSPDHSVRALAREPQSALRVYDLAFFLDVDGTLVEIAPTPAEVIVDTVLVDVLRALSLRTRGALAFVSGRSIATLDLLFQPLMLPAAGLHGFERRSAAGAYCRCALPPGELLSQARAALRAFCERHPALLLEDKRFALALHYRQAPDLEGEVLAEMSQVAAALGPSFALQRGRCVAELRPAEARKASAIEAFMQEPPFRGRRPVCLGDDLTDECAFDWINRAGGLSIGVGVSHVSVATAHLRSVQSARMWLQRLLEQPE